MVWMPAAIPAAAAASRTRVSAASNSVASAGSPGREPPRASIRSDGPTYTPSRPGVAQISSTLARPCAVSIITRTTVAALASAGTGPMRSADRMGP